MNRPQSGHLVDQPAVEGDWPWFLGFIPLAILAKPTASRAVNPRLRRMVVSTTSPTSKDGDWGRMKSVKASVDTIPAAPMPTNGCFIFFTRIR